MYQQIKQDPRMKLTIPYAVGDNYQGYRIVSTTREIFTEVEYRRCRKFKPQAGGRFFTDGMREAAIGSYVAQATVLSAGFIDCSPFGRGRSRA
ncbi:MAG TPA: hypothetical protein VG324_09235 [Blastocatellia bacterium]|nr:hypothetical protein [Blastocatellia bacterium]